MKFNICITFLFFTIFYSLHQKANAQIPGWMWAKSVGGTGNDLAHSATVDEAGNVYVTGSFEGTVDFDPGPGVYNLTGQGILDIYILKLDSIGNFVWANSFGGAGTEIGYSLTIDNGGNVYATGRYQNTVDFDPGAGTFSLTSNGYFDIFILKLNPSGNLVWAKSVGGTGDDEGFGISVDNSGFLLITGIYSDSVDFDPDLGIYNLTSHGQGDAFILKLQNSGSFYWARTFGGTFGDNGNAIAIDSLNNIYTTGLFTGTVDFDPGPGSVSITSNGYVDDFISKLDAGGNLVWARNLGGAQLDMGSGIYADNAGNVYSTGVFRGTADFDPEAGVYNLTSAGGNDIFISKLDHDGKFGWAGGIGEGVGGIPDEYSYAITADNEGNIYIAGSFKSTVDFDPGAGVFNLTSAGDNDAFVLKLDTWGNFIWAKRMGGPNSEQAISLGFDYLNHLYIVGHFMSYKVVFGNDTITNTINGGATADLFVARLDSGVNTTAIQSNEVAGSISIYPNPAKDLLVISYPVNGNKEATISVTDITGKIIPIAIGTITSKTQQTEINIQSFTAGVYFVQIQSDDFVTAKKFIVIR